MVTIAALQPEHHQAAHALMLRTPGVTVREADGFDSFCRYLVRNPGMSQVALSERGEVVGLILAGHDGRRGYLNHVLVHPALRGRGIARRLVATSMAALAADGIRKVYLDVRYNNAKSREFWEYLGWQVRDDLIRYSLINGADANA